MTLEEISEKITTILENSYDEDWIWDGEEERKVRDFDANYAKEQLIELVKQIIDSK